MGYLWVNYGNIVSEPWMKAERKPGKGIGWPGKNGEQVSSEKCVS
jgi:hypothetical protein